jgi:hypothetical protein
MSSDISPKKQLHGSHSTGWITISLDEYESITHTLDVLSDSGLMDQIEKSRKSNEGKDFEELANELGI